MRSKNSWSERNTLLGLKVTKESVEVIKGPKYKEMAHDQTEVNLLTLKWPRYFYSYWCPRGFHGTPKKNTFQPKFCNEICTIYVSTIKKIIILLIFLKNIVYTISKWHLNNQFLFCVISILLKFENHFPKEIFQWNLAQSRRTWIDLHYWNNI